MNFFVFLIPILTIFFLWVFFYGYLERSFFGFVKAFFMSILSFVLIVVFIVETLSLFNQLNSIYFLSILFVLSITLLFFTWNKIKTFFSLFPLKKIDFQSKFLLLNAIVFILIPLFVLGLSCAPNNWDSMTYHLPRVERWYQNESLSHYLSVDARQLFSGVLSEYLILAIKFFTGNDYFYFLVQYLSYIFSFFVLYLLLKTSGISRTRTYVFGILLLICLPIGILESTTTQNDYLVSILLLLSIFFALEFYKSKSVLDFIFFSISVALGLLSKQIFYIYISFAVLYIGFLVLKKYTVSELYKYVLIFIFFIFSVNIGHWTRNYISFGSPFGVVSDYNRFGLDVNCNIFSNEGDVFKTGILNIFRTSTNQLSLPIQKYNKTLENFTGVIANLLNVDINANLMIENEKYDVVFVPSEDYAGNFFHYVLFIFACLFYLINAKKYKNRVYVNLFLYFFLCNFIIYGFLFRWQPWDTRLFLPLFLVAIVFISIIFDKLVINNKLFVYILFLLLLTSTFFVFFNKRKPYIEVLRHIDNREDTYFIERSEPLKQRYYDIADVIISNNIKDIYLEIGNNNWEYPLYAILNNRGYVGYKSFHTYGDDCVKYPFNKPNLLNVKVFSLDPELPMELKP